jgi:DNA-binding beta-propeller fold protein YncE
MLKTMLRGGIALLALVATLPATAADWGPAYGAASSWALLPEGVRYPEGITANPANGDIFVGTFHNGSTANKLLRLGRDGRVIAQKDFGGTPLLGLGFAEGKVYILNFGASQLQRIDADFNAATAVEDVAPIPTVGAPAPRNSANPDGTQDTITFGNAFPAPNAMVFDRSGNLYISDSFQGAIFHLAAATTCTRPCAMTMFSHDPQLATPGFPPFGANGVALNADESVLYIANTGDNRVMQMALATKAITPFAESVHGADGLLFHDGILWVAANQADEVVGLNASGKVVAKVGFFEGIRSNGSPRGLLFPASMVIYGAHMYVANLALPLTPAVGDEPEESVTRWNVARFRNPLHR